MPLSVMVDGKWKDFRYIRQTPIITAFYLDEILIGQIFKARRGSYAGVLWGGHQYNGISGFKTRHAAAEYLLFIGGYRTSAQ